jgi:hypothetical protein
MMVYERNITTICPECKVAVKGVIYEDNVDGKIYMRKTCNKHGEFKDYIHSSKDEYVWRHKYLKDGTRQEKRQMKTKKGCPHDCGLCPHHINTPAICLIDVTNRCNLKCPICFANADATGYLVEPPFEDILKILKHFRNIKPQPPLTLQLSGGEPTVREDLPDIVQEAVGLGFQHIMITTNGLKMTKIEYCRELAEAGANAIYLQFDGLEPETYKKTRGKNILPQKLKAIDNWRILNKEFMDKYKRPAAGVALIPTIARGVNDHEITAIIDYALDNIDVIVAVIFQPIALCGRLSTDEVLKMRFTKSDLIEVIDAHTNGVCSPWYPISSIAEFAKIIDWFDNVETVEFSCHPDCGFANWLIKNERTGELEGVKHYIDIEKAVAYSTRMWNQIVAAGKQYNASWFYRKRKKLRYLLGVRKYLLKKGYVGTLLKRLIMKPRYETAENFMFGPNIMIGCMHFQDAYNMDTERVRRCLVHYGIYHPKHKKVLQIPFCTYNTIHRPRIERELAIFVAEPEKVEVPVVAEVPPAR